MKRGAPARAGARAAAAALAGLVLAASAGGGAACAGAGGAQREPPEPALRIWTPGIVHWSGRQRSISLDVENRTVKTVEVEAPAPRRARVVIFVGSGPDRVCGQDADPGGPAGEAVAVAPGEAREVRVDLAASCGGLPPGEYRYEVGYEAPAVGPGPVIRLRTVHGHVVVVQEGAPSLDRGSAEPERKARDPGATRGRRNR